MSKNLTVLKRAKAEEKKKTLLEEQREAVLKLIGESLTTEGIPVGTLRKIHCLALNEIQLAKELLLLGLPFCDCGEVIQRPQQVKKEGPNKGRFFYCCPKNQQDPSRCNMFRFAHDKEVSKFVRLEGGGEAEEEEVVQPSSPPYTQDSQML